MTKSSSSAIFCTEVDTFEKFKAQIRAITYYYPNLLIFRPQVCIGDSIEEAIKNTEKQITELMLHIYYDKNNNAYLYSEDSNPFTKVDNEKLKEIYEQIVRPFCK